MYPLSLLAWLSPYARRDAFRRLAIGALAFAMLPAFAQRQQTRRDATASSVPARPVQWADVRAIFDAHSDIFPQSLRVAAAEDRPAAWNAWRAAHRQRLAERLARGDLDSIVNLLLFGTSFTPKPRLTASLLEALNRKWIAGDGAAQQRLLQLYQDRTVDLVAAASRPNAGERMGDVRRILAAHGHSLATPDGRRAAADYLIEQLVRIRREAVSLAADLEAARKAPDSTAAFAERSRIFRDRGLAGDSSVLTQFAVDRAVCALRDHGLLSNRAVNRVAIVGPGLDFADKQEGFDFYPPQSLQPFTLVDSLLRCDLASRAERLGVTTLDVSPRVNAHLRAAVSRGTYRLVFPWDTEAGWTDEAGAYWKRAGDRIGAASAVDRAPLPPGVRARGVTVAPEIVRMIRPLEASIVSDRLDFAEGERFDLVLATNVLLYYDTFEQTLALDAVAAMLRPGGVLLTNDAVLEVPEIPMRSQGYVTVAFSTRQGDGERMVFYVRK